MRKPSIFYGAMMLTSVHLLLRLVGTSFQVYLSGRIGAAGIGLLQLTMSVGSFAMVAGMAGIRTGTMYLTAEELGKKRHNQLPFVLSACIRYSLAASGIVALILFSLAPAIADNWISNSGVRASLRLFSAFLPISCLCGVMAGYFTAAGRIGILAAVEVAEQLFSMAVTILALTIWADTDPVKACESVILGSGAGSVLTLTCLIAIARKDCECGSRPQRLWARLGEIALPLAMADVLKSGITTTENLMVPKRLALHPATAEPLAAFGILSGMVFPVLMFPACILFGLADLLIPELARCAAAGSQKRIRYLVKRGLKIAMLYALLFCGGMYLLSDKLCLALYKNAEAGVWLRRYALMLPMLYCDCLVDAMTKGLGQQRACVRYNIITSSMDVALLFLLLPKYGMQGYYASFLITHLVNFLLSLRRLLRITQLHLPMRVPLLCTAAAAAALWISQKVGAAAGSVFVFVVVLGCLLILFGILGAEDFSWLSGILKGKAATYKEESPVSI